MSSPDPGADLVHDDGVRVPDASAGAVHLSALLPVSGLSHEALAPPDLITHRDSGHQGQDTQTQAPHCHCDDQLTIHLLSPIPITSLICPESAVLVRFEAERGPWSEDWRTQADKSQQDSSQQIKEINHLLLESQQMTFFLLYNSNA